jgi:ATP-dependent protease ClpP protease subunit
MFHTYSSHIYGKRNEIISQIEHTDKHLENFTKRLLSPYFSKKEIKKMANGKDIWLTSKEMIERGICTHIIDNGEVREIGENNDDHKKV